MKECLNCGKLFEVTRRRRAYCERACLNLHMRTGPYLNPKFGKENHAYRHGMVDTPTFCAWQAMRTRCTNKKYNQYHAYGGRGIKVCKRWDDFVNFLADMGVRPDGLSLDRINNDGDYKPSNCRWASIKEQQNNCSRNVRITVGGVSKTLAQWEEATGVNRATIRWRHKNGWSKNMLFSTAKRMGNAVKYPKA